MIKKIILSIITLSALLVGQKAYWVDVTNGNDSNDGSSENQAFKTIQYFTSSVNWADGDTLYVKPSEDGSGNLTYYDFGNNEANINSSNDLVIIGTGGRDRTIFDAESKNRHFEKNREEGLENTKKTMKKTIRKTSPHIMAFGSFLRWWAGPWKN